MEKQEIKVIGISLNEAEISDGHASYTIVVKPSLKNYPIQKVMDEIGKALSKIKPIENHTL